MATVDQKHEERLKDHYFLAWDQFTRRKDDKFIEAQDRLSVPLPNYWRDNIDCNHYRLNELLKDESVTPNEIMACNEKLVCLRGVSGIGKTSLLNSLSHAGKTFMLCSDQQYNFVFDKLCREISSITDCNSLKVLLMKQFPEVLNTIMYEDLLYISAKVLIIFDGIDEFSYLNDIRKLSEGAANVTPIVKCVYEAINPFESSLMGASALISGWVEALTRIQNICGKENNIKTIELLGFSPEYIVFYMSKYFPDKIELYNIINESQSMNNVTTSESLMIHWMCHNSTSPIEFVGHVKIVPIEPWAKMGALCDRKVVSAWAKKLCENLNLKENVLKEESNSPLGSYSWLHVVFSKLSFLSIVPLTNKLLAVTFRKIEYQFNQLTACLKGLNFKNVHLSNLEHLPDKKTLFMDFINQMMSSVDPKQHKLRHILLTYSFSVPEVHKKVSLESRKLKSEKKEKEEYHSEKTENTTIHLQKIASEEIEIKRNISKLWKENRPKYSFLKIETKIQTSKVATVNRDDLLKSILWCIQAGLKEIENSDKNLKFDIKELDFSSGLHFVLLTFKLRINDYYNEALEENFSPESIRLRSFIRCGIQKHLKKNYQVNSHVEFLAWYYEGENKGNEMLEKDLDKLELQLLLNYNLIKHGSSGLFLELLCQRIPLVTVECFTGLLLSSGLKIADVLPLHIWHNVRLMDITDTQRDKLVVLLSQKVCNKPCWYAVAKMFTFSVSDILRNFKEKKVQSRSSIKEFLKVLGNRFPKLLVVDVINRVSQKNENAACELIITLSGLCFFHEACANTIQIENRNRKTNTEFMMMITSTYPKLLVKELKN